MLIMSHVRYITYYNYIFYYYINIIDFCNNMLYLYSNRLQ